MGNNALFLLHFFLQRKIPEILSSQKYFAGDVGLLGR
jgi:hypothetical protein